MTKDEFFTCLHDSIGVLCTKTELDEIFKHFDRDDDGKINYLELAHDLLQLPRPKGQAHMGLIRPRGTSLGEKCKRMVQMLVEMAERAACPASTLAGIFKLYDTDGSGLIAYDEVAAMVKDCK